MKNSMEWKFKPTTAEEIAACSTVAGMRERIAQAEFYLPLVRSVACAKRHAEFQGRDFTELDAMTMIAFHALINQEHLQDLHLEFLQTMPIQRIIPL